MMLRGRTAQELVFSDPSNGAAHDIEKATDLARKMVMEYGMSDELGPMKYGTGQGEVFLGRDYAQHTDYSDELASLIDTEVRKLITQAHDEARDILTHHRDVLDRLAKELMDKESLDSDEVAEVFAPIRKWVFSTNGSGRIVPPTDLAEPEAHGSSSGDDGIAAASSDDGGS
ncbi:MAG: cell division protein FtsH, partial [Acidimicrobiia bacterium]